MSTNSAQITYTTSPLLSPTVIGGFVTFLATIASALGVHVLDDPQLQQTLVVVIGLAGTGIARYLWPHNDGRLSFTAPLSTPTPQTVPVGSSVVTVPTRDAPVQTSDVLPLEAGKSTVTVPPTPMP